MVEKRIFFRFNASEVIGMGHTYRCIQLMESIGTQKCEAVIDQESYVAIKALQEKGIKIHVVSTEKDFYKLIEQEKIEIVVNDILNTSIEYMEQLKLLNCRVINLEDEGPGAEIADAVINELYENSNRISNRYYGHKYYCAPRYLLIGKCNAFHEKVKKIIVLFGCTDPGMFTEKTMEALAEINGIENYEIHVIVGPGNSRLEQIKELAISRDYFMVKQNVNMYEELKDADVAISSQGRTIFELAYMNIPAIIMSQNEREMLHTFACEVNGFRNLGLGRNISISELKKEIEKLICDDHDRESLFRKMKRIDFKDNMNEIIRLIEGE